MTVERISAGNHERYQQFKDGCHIDRDGRTPLHLAAFSARNWECLVEEAIKAGCNHNATDRFGKTAVHYAVERENVGCLEKLIQKRCNLDAISSDGLTPLMMAAVKGDPGVMRILIKGGAKTNLANVLGETALHYTAGCTPREHTTTNTGAKGGGNSLVILDCDDQMIVPSSKKNPEAIRILIAGKADLNKQDETGRTALHWTAERNDSDCADLLIEAGASLDIEDKEGGTPFGLAIKCNSPGVMQSLIKAGCDRTAIDGLMGTALALAAIKGHTAIVEILLLIGEDPDECGYFGMTPLMLSSYESHVDIVKTLLSMGADPNTIGRMGGTTLKASLLRVNPSNEVARHQIVAILLRANVNVRAHNTSKGLFKSACNNGDNSPLSYAITVGYVSLMQMLMIAGSEIPQDEFSGWMETANIGKFYKISQLKAVIAEWKWSIPSLKSICRSCIRRSIDGKMEASIKSLPIARRLQSYLDYEEFDDMEIERADLVEGASPGMVEAAGMTPCGLSALEGILRR